MECTNKALVSEHGFLHVSYLLVGEQVSVLYNETNLPRFPKSRARKVARLLVDNFAYLLSYKNRELPNSSLIY